ncbi:hypothetical protein DHEL01_v204989 [Diaporthe helianthi]|uniref:Zinc-binding loop region of homing endonuclease domain-containing protein n=1 Tax=Diaporthe helianthi TaxID=158607 RepID=A0A2P5I2B7_DIAHE|nr:hypothetical protein DHEL01_v204989 [Diaporthe helianthi]
MGRRKDLKVARRPPPVETYIHPPSVKTERINGKDIYTKTPARPGYITINLDCESESPLSRPRAVKREQSRGPPGAVKQGRQSSQPQIKQEPLGDGHGPPRIHRQRTPATVASDTGRTQSHVPVRQRQSQEKQGPPSDSSWSSDSSDSDSSDSSEAEGESDSSSDSNDSNEDSSSEDDANASVHWPTTPASSLGSSPLKTRGKKETKVQRASANLLAASPSRRSVQNEASVGLRHAPMDFVIDLPARPLPSAPDLPRRSRSHISPSVEPVGAQARWNAHPSHNRPSNHSPVVLGFMPINRASPPPRNAPTEPRAMRIPGAGLDSVAVSSFQKHSESMSRSVPGPSSRPPRAPQVVKDNSQKKGDQRRGPARHGRIMQTIEQQPVESLSTSSPPKNALPRRELKAATPGLSSRRTAPPPASPGLFVIPRAVTVRPNPIVGTRDPPQSVSLPQRKRAFDETGDTDSASKAAEWERMLARVKAHEREMERQRAQLEDTKRLLAEQKSRIDDLEQRRRAADLVRDSAAQTIQEPDPDPLPNVAHRHVPPAPVPPARAERREERRRQASCQSERRDKRKGRISSRVARARMQEQERERIEQERQEDLELQQQLKQEQRRQAERVQCAARAPENNARQGQAQPGPAQRMLDAVQRRIQHDMFNQPLSGHNLQIRFDDDDRGHISEATAFLMRLPQSFILARLRRVIEGKDFFETTHLGSTHLGCWVVSRRASCDLRMKLTDSGESHSFSFARLAARLWHDEQSIYSLLQHQNRPLKAGHTCHVDACMRPDHIVIETDRDAGERRKCKARGRCYGHRTVHKDGTRQVRKPCIFFPRSR